MEKAEAFEKNEQLSYISNRSTSPTNDLDALPASCDSYSPVSSLQMPQPIRYSRLSHPPENLSRSITPNLPPPGTLEYYLASVPTTPQRMTPELENMADPIPYAPPLPPSECGILNNESIFAFDNLPSPASQAKRKEPIRPWELVADDIVKALEIPSISPIKKSIKRRAKRRSIMPIHITAAASRSRRGIQPS